MHTAQYFQFCKTPTTKVGFLLFTHNTHNIDFLSQFFCVNRGYNLFAICMSCRLTEIEPTYRLCPNDCLTAVQYRQTDSQSTRRFPPRFPVSDFTKSLRFFIFLYKYSISWQARWTIMTAMVMLFRCRAMLSSLAKVVVGLQSRQKSSPTFSTTRRTCIWALKSSSTWPRW